MTLIQFEIILKKGALMFSKFTHMQFILIFSNVSHPRNYLFYCVCLWLFVFVFSVFCSLQSLLSLVSINRYILYDQC